MKVALDERHIVTEIANNDSVYSNQISLKIRKVQTTDFGGYTCFTENSIGKSTAAIRLRGKVAINKSIKIILQKRFINK